MTIIPEAHPFEQMARWWFLTSTFYGNWLPGDPRGFVGRVRDRRGDDPASGSRIDHDVLGTEYDQNLPGLHRAAQSQMVGEAIRIEIAHAKILLAQFRETCQFRGWRLRACAIMADHVHWIVGVADDPEPEILLKDLKSYGSRALNLPFGKPPGGTWWTSGGSTRKIRDAEAFDAIFNYVTQRQPNPLIVFPASGGRESPEEGAKGESQ